MRTHYVNNNLRALVNRVDLCALGVLALSFSGLRTASALPPGGGGPHDPDPAAKPVYKPDLYISQLLKADAHNVLVYVRNKGNLVSKPCSLHLIVYTYDVITGWLSTYTIANFSVPAIEPGGFSSVWTNTEPSIYFKNFLFWFGVDYYNVNDEWYESNNSS